MKRKKKNTYQRSPSVRVFFINANATSLKYYSNQVLLALFNFNYKPNVSVKIGWWARRAGTC